MSAGPSRRLQCHGAGNASIRTPQSTAELWGPAARSDRGPHPGRSVRGMRILALVDKPGLASR
ncbi:hypothetical protein IMZ48_16220 [Candidatus Bathyarchaeota archaeon]|nr:hypothetical protein [Candidatus Bathyarchaeota archaeon]